MNHLDDEALASAREALSRAGLRAVLSHETAAQLLGLALLEPPSARRLTVPRNRSRLVVPGWEVVRRDVPLRDRVLREGLPCTGPARTVSDLARTLPTPEALVVADSALRGRLVRERDLRRRLLRAEGSGAGRLRLVGSLVDAGSGSALESLLRWTLHEAGLPAPVTQHRIRDGAGREVARVDFCWPEEGLVVEADGFAFHSERSAYRRDRERTNSLVRLGWRVLRFTWEDVRHRPGYVVGLVRACLADAALAA